MKKILLLTAIIVSIFVNGLQAQTKIDERNFFALKSYYESGQYKTGLNRIRQNERYYKKKYGNNNYYVAAIQAYEALIYAELGKFEKYETSLTSALNSYKTSTDTNTLYQLKANRLIADAHAVVGKFNEADSLLTSIQPNMNDYRLRDEILQAKVLHYSYLYKKGYLNKVSDSLHIMISETKKRIVEKDSITDRKGKFQFGKLTKFEQFNRKELYAKTILLQVEVVFAKGKMDSALTILNDHSEWIKKNIGYRGGVLAKTYFLHGMLAAENDDLKEAGKWFGKASGAAIKYYKTNSPFNAEIQEQIINNLLRQHRFEEATIKNNDLDVKILSYYGKQSLTYQNNNLIDVDREIASQNWKKASRHFEEYLLRESLPAIHMSRLEVLKKLYSVYLSMNDLEKAEKILGDAIQISLKLYGKNAPSHHLLLLRQAEFFTEYTDHYKEAEAIYKYSFDKVIREEIPHGNRNYYKNNYGEARLFEVLEKYSNAYLLFEELLKETEKLSGNTSVPYAIVLEKYANLDVTSGKYLEAEKKIKASLLIFEAHPQTKYNTDKLHALETNLRLQIVEGKFEEASGTLSVIKKLLSSTTESEEQLYASVEEIPLLNIYLGKFQQTENNLNEIIAGREKRFGLKHRSLINPLLYKGYLKLVTGNYNEAEESISRAGTIAQTIFGDKSLKYSECLVYYKKLYFAVGDYEKAEKSIQQVVDIQTAQFGGEHITVGKYLHELALAKYYYSASKSKIVKADAKTDIGGAGTTRGIESKKEKQKTSSEVQSTKTSKQIQEEIKQLSINDMFDRSYGIIKKELGVSNPEYALALENGASHQMLTGNYERAYQSIDQAKNIWVATLGEENVNSARIYAIAGNLQYLKGNYEEALKQFSRSRDMYKSIFDDNHPGYIEAQGRCAQMYYILGDIKKAVLSSEETIEKSLVYLDKVFPGLSERGKSNYWEKVKTDYEFYKTLAFTQHQEYPDMIGKVFNITLRTKAILLNTSVKVKQKILSSGDTTLILNYEKWQGLKEDLGAAVSMSASQRKESGIDPVKMESEIEALEKVLSLGSDLFAKNYEKKNRYDWSELKKAISKNEVVIEVVPFRFFDKKFTDTVWYAMLGVSERTKSMPDFVILKNGQELQKKYMKYYRNCIKFQMADEESYKAYWEQLGPLIGNESTTVYLSADGVYNQLNLETLKTPDGNYLINKNKIILIGSSRDLIDRSRMVTAKKAKNTLTTDNVQVTLLGNPDYYKADFSINKTISQLPGAEIEVKKINEVLAGSKYHTEVFLNDKATEATIKELTGPKIFHIATHGFFLEDSEQEELDDVAEKAVQNPLLRSGLLLKNGGQILQNENVYAFNKEDGILTAYEAMNLNFDNTELVVLSACETGLGEVKLGEGVLGLQRSFLVAGSKTIIMSLFKVSDAVTTELMSSFYTKWLSGQTKRNAFVEAKKEIMVKYDNPQYWGAFIMIGLE